MSILPVVLFDDIELWATTRLRALLDAREEDYAADVFIGNEVPNPRLPRMVIIRRDGGGRLDSVRESPRLGVNVWATSKQEANDLGRLVAALLWASPDGDPVSRVTITGGPYPVADDTKDHRVYITAELVSKGRNA